MSPRVWKALDENGVFASVAEMRTRYDIEKADAKAKKEADASEKRASEEAMKHAEPKTRRDDSDPKQEERKKAGFDEETKCRFENSGADPRAIEPVLQAETQARRWVVDFETLPAGSPFFRLVPVGNQRRLWINRGHRFYSQVYAGPDSNEGTRAQWEVMLFTLGDCEISASEELAAFYESERVEWSRRLMVTLAELGKIMPPAEPNDEQNDQEVDAA
jgi:hypothetical protein